MALDFFAGCVGGCAGVIVGHPLDTVKVKLQTQDAHYPKYKGTYDCLRSLLIKEGIRGIYRGLSSPLSSVAFINAVVFGVYGNTQRNLSNPDSLKSHFNAGAIAGFTQSFICSPVELIKTRLQVTTDPTLKGPWDCLRKIYKTDGFKGVFRGLGITIVREIPSSACYFWSYEYLTRSEEPVSTLKMLGAGGVSGVMSWLIVYPVDVIKSRIQADSGMYKNSIDCLKHGLATEGPNFLFKGLTPTLLRAFPVNAATFTFVTWTMRLCDTLIMDRDGLMNKLEKMLKLKVSDVEAI